MAPLPDNCTPNQFRDVILGVYTDEVKMMNVPNKFSVPTQLVRLTLDDLRHINDIQVKTIKRS